MAEQGSDAVTASHRLRDRLLDARFTVQGVEELLGSEAAAALHRGEFVPARRALRGDASAAASLARLFLLGDVVQPTGELPLDDLVSLGLVEVAGSQAVARLDLRPYGDERNDWYVVSDRAGIGGRLVPDHVLGVGAAGLTLARLVPRLPVGRALDLGTGCGVQALHLAAHAGRVVATDVSPRACRLAGLTAALSGQEWDLRTGSLFGPVSRESFDLVVSNPPFVVGGGGRFTYRDAGLPGDRFGASLVRSAPSHLAAGGTAVLLLNWLHVRGEDWHERVRSWLAPEGVEAWVAQRDVSDPSRYVELWLDDEGADGGDRDGRYEEWLEALDRLDVEGVGFGWIALRRSDDGTPSTVRFDDVAGARRLPDGAEVAQTLAAVAALHRLDAVGLLDARPRPTIGVRLQRSQITAGSLEWLPLPTGLEVAGGWREALALDDLGAHLVRALDGRVTLGDAVDLVAADRDADPDDVLAGALVLVRELIATGAVVLS